MAKRQNCRSNLVIHIQKPFVGFCAKLGNGSAWHFKTTEPRKTIVDLSRGNGDVPVHDRFPVAKKRNSRELGD
eukprot:12891067-Prorocentrum_lima.AAC.1